MAVEKRTLWLGGVLVAALVAAIVVRSMDATPTVRPTPPRRTAAARAGSVEDSGPAAEVKLDRLKAARSEPATAGRNPFRFTPKAAPPSSAPPPPRAGAAIAGNATPAIAMAPTGPPPPPPITLKYIGLVEKADGTKIAVLSDGRRPLHGVEGQEIEGQYRILKIGLESVEIAYLDGRGRQVIRLTGK